MGDALSNASISTGQSWENSESRKAKLLLDIYLYLSMRHLVTYYCKISLYILQIY